MPLSLPALLTPVILAMLKETELYNNSSLTPIVYGLALLFLEQQLFFSHSDTNRPTKAQSSYCVCAFFLLFFFLFCKMLVMSRMRSSGGE